MDQARLQEVQAQVNQLTIIAAVLLVTSGMCGSTLCGSPGIVARLKRVTKVLLEGLSCTRWVTLSFLFQKEKTEYAGTGWLWDEQQESLPGVEEDLRSK